MAFKPQKGHFIQIVHDGHAKHWITLSDFGSKLKLKPDTINVHDSLSYSKPGFQLQKTAAAILR